MSFFKPLQTLPGIFTAKSTNPDIHSHETPHTVPASPTSDVIPSSRPALGVPDRSVETQCNQLRSMNSKRRVSDLRKIFIPESAELHIQEKERQIATDAPLLHAMRGTGEDEPDSNSDAPHAHQHPPHPDNKKDQNNVEGTESLSPLEYDFLWLAVTLVESTKSPVICRLCERGFVFPKECAWCLHGCRHCYHVSCFRGFLHGGRERNFGEGKNEQDEQQERCFCCDALRSQAQGIAPAELSARIRRLEKNLLPHMAETYFPTPLTPF